MLEDGLRYIDIRPVVLLQQPFSLGDRAAASRDSPFLPRPLATENTLRETDYAVAQPASTTAVVGVQIFNVLTWPEQTVVEGIRTRSRNHVCG